MIKPSTEDALALCGRDRVLHREHGAKPAVAIRWDQEARATAPDGTERFLVREGVSLDEAGRLAAVSFAQRLLDLSASYKQWADGIFKALERSK